MTKCILLCAVSVLALACGNAKEPEAPSAPPAESPASPQAAETPPPAAPVSRGKPFEVYNACTEVVTIAVGAEPKSDDAGRRTIAGTSSIELPRDGEGNQTVWLLDANGEPLLDVHVTRGMKRVEIGRSCRTLDAR